MSTTQYAVAAAAAASATLAIVAYRDYAAYCALGDHGLPGNFSGWCTQLKLTRRSRKDTTVPAPYDLAVEAALAGPHAAASFLPPRLPARAGARPTIPGFAAPQRQVTDTASAATKARMYGHLEALAGANAALLQYELSMLEGPVPALQLHNDGQTAGRRPPKHLQRTRGEIAHVHPPDGSTHLVLSLADSRRVIETGWGQRHRLSGTMLGWGYTLVYAPRNEDEFQLWKGVVAAAAKYACADIGPVQLV